jgi:hypothetical protein
MLVKGQAARANMQLDDNYREWPILAALAIHSARTGGQTTAGLRGRHQCIREKTTGLSPDRWISGQRTHPPVGLKSSIGLSPGHRDCSLTVRLLPQI